MERNISELVPVDINSFRNVTRDLSFDVYMKLSEDNVVHVFSKTTGLDYKRLAQYIQKGVAHLWVNARDLEIYKTFTAKSAESVFLDAASTQEKKIAALLNMTEQNMAELFTQVEVSTDTAEDSKKVMKSYVDLMTQNPNSLAVILKLVSHGEYLYYHSIAVAIFSMFIGKATGQFDRKGLELLGLGAFLHDIGSVHISKDIVCSPNDLTPEQWEEMHGHTKIGLKMVENTSNIPDEVRYVIYQHHEQPSGRGYPNGLSGNAIYYPARIVALADGFSAMISKRPFRPAYTVEQALGILQSEVGKYDKDLVQILYGILTSRRGGLGGKAA